MKKIVLITALSMLFLMNSYVVKAQAASEDPKEKTAQAKPQNVGNKICPVSGDKVDENGMPGATYEYQGKIYNFCCSSCIEEFKKDPKKYIKKINEELKTSSQDEGAASPH